MNRNALAAVCGACVTLLPATGLAQAWLPPKGEVSSAFGYQYIRANEHLLSNGQKGNPGEMRWNSVVADLSYGVTDHFALRASLPFVVSRYEGSLPHRPLGRPGIDDGQWHDTLADFRFEARYMVSAKGFAITPFVSDLFPSHDYETLAHAAASKGIWEVGTGVNVGRLLDPLLPDSYFQLRYGYTFAEKVLDVSHNRSNVNLELGYFVTPALSVRALGAWQDTYGGFQIPADAQKSAVNFAHHDQLAEEGYLRVGLGVGYALTGSVDVFASGYYTLSGHNSLPASSLSIGFAQSFSPARIIRKRHRQSAEPPREPRP